MAIYFRLWLFQLDFLHAMGHGPTLLTCIHDQPLEDLVSGDSPKDLLLKISKI
jgi:hypothetical protein